MSRLTKKVGENYCSQNGDFYDLYNKLGRLEDLEEQIGCPLEVRLQIVNGTIVYDNYGNAFKIEFVAENIFIGFRTKSGGTSFKYNDYKKTWWLKEDRSE